MKCWTRTVLLVLIAELLSLSHAVAQHTIPRNWLEKDPGMDSIAGISLDKAYDLLKDRKFTAIIVAVIDNGVDIDHEDMKNIIWTNTKEVPDNNLDDDHNGYIDDIHGWNFRGTTDGTVVENEQASSLQYFLAEAKRYEHFDSSRLKGVAKEQFMRYKKAEGDYLYGKLTTTGISDKQYAFNLDYHSFKLIAGDSTGDENRFYGSPFSKLSSNLTHGTHVAGIIAAERGNGIGINGIANHVLIMPITATTAVGDERDKDIANAIFYAVNNGARIINMSFSKLFSSNKSLVDKAIRYAEDRNVLMVHAAGNDGANIDSVKNYHYPISLYNNGSVAKNFITVGWSRPLFDYRLAHPNSNYGKKNVDLFAPGSDVYSTVPGNQYADKSGSSMSAPVVSGVAASVIAFVSGQYRSILSIDTHDHTY